MRTVSELISNEIKNRPLLEQGLAQGVINLSALARQLKPKIEQINLKKTSVGAIVMALQRLGSKIKKQAISKTVLPKLTDVTVRSQLVEFTFNNLTRFDDLQKKVAGLAQQKPNSFVNLSQGMFETTLIVNRPLDEDVKKVIPKNQIINEIKNLSAVIIRFEEDTVYIPGVYYQILKALAWEKTNLIEIISVSNELSLFFEDSKIEQAFRIIKELVAA